MSAADERHWDVSDDEMSLQLPDDNGHPVGCIVIEEGMAKGYLHGFDIPEHLDPQAARRHAIEGVRYQLQEMLRQLHWLEHES